MSESKTKKKIEKKVKDEKYFEAVGRRKTSVARVRFFPEIKLAKSEYVVNEKDVNIYFPTKELQRIVESPLKRVKVLGKYKISVKVAGGGIHSQAEALRHGVSRALIVFDPEFRKILKKAQFLTRDQRTKERRKFGLKKARKAPQWKKR